MPKNSVIKKERSVMHFLFIITSQLLLGISIIIMIATQLWVVHPYWYLILLAAVMILIPTLYKLTMAEEKEELKLKKRLKN